MVELTNEQRRVLYHIVKDIKDGKKEIKMGGFGGTGKSTLIKYLVKFFPKYKVAAFTGKAANVLRKKRIESSTIHSLIYAPVIEHGILTGFDLTDNLDADGIIIDESSMVSKELYDDLKSFKLPVIYVGDHGQLEPVGSDFNLMKKPDYTLEQIHRNAGEIALFAQHLRNGYAARSYRPTTDKVIFMDQWSVTPQQMTTMDQIICAYNKTRVDINHKVRAALGFQGELSVNERIMCLKNNKKLGLFNGMQGFVRALYKKRNSNRMDFEFDEKIYPGIKYDKRFFGQEKPDFKYLDQDSPSPFDYAYCATAHKCVHPDTLVETTEGLLPIKLIAKTGTIATPSGPQPYKNFVHNPENKSLNIKTKHGYEITVTPDHKVETYGSEMSLASNLTTGDVVRVFIGSQIQQPDSGINIVSSYYHNANVYKTPKFIDGDLAEFLGIMVADGTLWHKGFRVVKRHPEDVTNFINLCKTLFGITAKPIDYQGTPGAEVLSTMLSDWLSKIGGLAPNDKDVPELILRSNIRSQCRFLRGLFTDGWVSIDSQTGNFDHIGWFTKFPILCQKTRSLLLRMGIVSSGLSTRLNNDIFIYGDYAKTFAKYIGFEARFKMDRLITTNSRYDCIPIAKTELDGLRSLFSNDKSLTVYDYQNARSRERLSRINIIRLCELLGEDNELSHKLMDRLKYFYTKISSIKEAECESMCVEVPQTHKFIQNGFPFGNCQGDEWDKVMVMEQKSGLWDHRRWAYTAASRAMEQLVWVS